MKEVAGGGTWEGLCRRTSHSCYRSRPGVAAIEPADDHVSRWCCKAQVTCFCDGHVTASWDLGCDTSAPLPSSNHVFPSDGHKIRHILIKTAYFRLVSFSSSFELEVRSKNRWTPRTISLKKNEENKTRNMRCNTSTVNKISLIWFSIRAQHVYSSHVTVKDTPCPRPFTYHQWRDFAHETQALPPMHSLREFSQLIKFPLLNRRWSKVQ